MVLKNSDYPLTLNLRADVVEGVVFIPIPKGPIVRLFVAPPISIYPKLLVEINDVQLNPNYKLLFSDAFLPTLINVSLPIVEEPDNIFVLPPTFTAPATPSPPETTNAPVVVDVDAVVAAIETLPILSNLNGL
jgi:hypothetical protein